MEVDEPISLTNAGEPMNIDKLPALKSVEGYVVLVTNLHEETTEDDVLDKFEEFGKVTNIHLNIDKQSGYIKGYALIEFETEESAVNAIQATFEDGIEIYGNQVKADFAFLELPQSNRVGNYEETRRDKSPSRS